MYFLRRREETYLETGLKEIVFRWERVLRAEVFAHFRTAVEFGVDFGLHQFGLFVVDSQLHLHGFFTSPGGYIAES